MDFGGFRGLNDLLEYFCQLVVMNFSLICNDGDGDTMNDQYKGLC